jgi:hypothetical protein
MSGRRKNAGAGYGYMFSGAFAKKADAVAKEKKRKGSFVKAVFLPTGMRYAVMTPRTNPRKVARKNPKQYEVTRQFIGGTLQGLTHTEITPVRWKVGQVVRAPIGGSPYKIVSVRVVGENPSRPFIGPDGKVWHSGKRKAKLTREILVEGRKFRKWEPAHRYAVRLATKRGDKIEALVRETDATGTHELRHYIDSRTNPIERARTNASGGYFSERMGAGSREIIIWANTPAGPFHVQPYMSNGDSYGREVGKYKTLETARRKAHAYFQRMGWASDVLTKSHRTLGENPAELLVMGANPHNGQEIVMQPGSTLTIRNNPEPRENIYLGFGPAPASERLTVYRKPREARSTRGRVSLRRPARGDDSALRTEVAAALVDQGYKKAAAKKAARLAAGSDFSSLFQSAINEVRRENPICGARIGGYVCSRKPGHKGPHLPQGATMRTRTRLPHHWQPRENNPSAAALREKFTGAEVAHVRILDEPHMPAGDYAQLGKLLALYVRPRTGGQVQMIEAHNVVLVSDETARQIYFVGGDQDVSAGLRVFGAVDRGAGLFELGEARRIDYRQRKEHVPHPESDSWRHEFGEETGERPVVLYDSRAKRLLLEGGAYEIREEGIVN